MTNILATIGNITSNNSSIKKIIKYTNFFRLNLSHNKITVGITAYNCHKYLINAIESVINQSVEYWNGIIILDGESDKNTRKLFKENKVLSLTEKEAMIISFLKNADNAVSINELQKNVWGYKSKLETHTVETHVYRLRKKISKTFDDNNFIQSLKSGYKL